MIIQAKIRGFICTTAHPHGCGANVRDMIKSAKEKSFDVTKNTLILGASTGYGLASMITAAFSCNAKTIGVSFDKAAAIEKKRTATAGWYNLAAFADEAEKAGLEHYSVIGDAFSNECKDEVIKLIKEKLGKIDMLIYSLASPVRMDPNSGVRYNSVIKPIGDDFKSKAIDLNKWTLNEVTLEAAKEEEIEATVKVMGGEDWLLWMDALKEADVLAKNPKTVAYSYIGPEITHPIYTNGTIGRAKEDLLNAANKLKSYADAYISVNKAVVTQASSAIPAVPLYITMLFKEMKKRGVHEDCIEQMIRMFEKFDNDKLNLDDKGRLRMDDLEMEGSLQKLIIERWNSVDDQNLSQYADTEAYRSDFMKLFGFGREDIDYGADVEADLSIKNSTIL